MAFALLALAGPGCGVGVADNNVFAPPLLAEDTAVEDNSTGGFDSSISASSSASAETSDGDSESGEGTTSIGPEDANNEESSGSSGTGGMESGDSGGEASEFPAGTTTWRGVYSCAQGETRLELVLTHSAGGGLEGVFAFAPTDSNPEVEEGSFAVSGWYAPGDGAVDLVPGAWIEQPKGWTTISLAGTLDPMAMTISGDVLDLECSTFDVALE